MDDSASTTDARPGTHTAGRPAAERARLETLAANTIRGLTIDAVEAAQSGHAGLPMGMADAAVVLWTRFLKHDPADPAWADRDRFVLSAGHGSMLIYSLLHLAGYDVSLDDLRAFRTLGSKTPGHPEVKHTPGVEATTGPLGQGLAMAVGLALAERHLAARFNTPDHVVVNHHTYVIASDGDLQEGVTNEASSLAGTQGLGTLVVLYDDNEVSIDGRTGLSFTENVPDRYAALGWHVVRDVDGHDAAAVALAIETARNVLDRPSLIAVRTTIGYGSPNKAGKSSIHSDALGTDEINATKDNLGIPREPAFLVPDDALVLLREQAERGRDAHAAWTERVGRYADSAPAKAAEFHRRLDGRGTLPDGWKDALPTFPADANGMATRKASGATLDALAAVIPDLVGGSADLTPSNNTLAKGMAAMSAGAPEGRYVHYGIREHAMGAVLNGLAMHGGIRPYGGTFLVFSDYCKPAVRLAALMRTTPVFVFTHDTVGLGQDGPTHQPVEQLAGLRAIPHLLVIRPADANETAAAWAVALDQPDRPTALALSRQNVPTLPGTVDAAREGVARGAYTVDDCEGVPDVLLVAAGSEVSLCIEAKQQLDGLAVRVVSMPCERLFFEQDDAYRESVLPAAVRARVAVEAGAPGGWYRVAGLDGRVVGLDRFGESGPGPEVYAALGFTPEAVAEAARAFAGA